MPRDVVAYHITLSAYGFWLPNDPRGSWSTYVRSQALYEHGPASKVDTRHTVAHAEHDCKQRLEAKKALTRPPVRFTGTQAQTIALAFGRYASRTSTPIHACAVMPDHVHLVLSRHDIAAERVAQQLKAAATTALIDRNLHPFRTKSYANGRLPSPWARGQWVVFLFDDTGVQRAVDYVNNNPIKDGLPPQRWSFVTPFDALPR